MEKFTAKVGTVLKSNRASENRINCLNCRHYYITWDRNFPRGCRALEFKTRFSPAVVVYRSSGMKCLYYSPKK